MKLEDERTRYKSRRGNTSRTICGERIGCGVRCLGRSNDACSRDLDVCASLTYTTSCTSCKSLASHHLLSRHSSTTDISFADLLLVRQDLST
jgi:hypothetical protein